MGNLKSACMLALVSAVAWSPAVAGGEVQSVPRGIAISEVVFLPATPDAPVQIELCSISGSPVDVSGWCITDKDARRFVIPAMPPVPSGAFVVIEFGPAFEERDDLTFGDNVARLRCRAEWSAKAFRGTLNECALYSDADRKTDHLVDFVRWGRTLPPNRITTTDAYGRAVARGLWRRGTGVFVADPAPGDPPAVRPGGSIARKVFATRRSPDLDWFVASPSDASIGLPNPWPTPFPLFPQDGEGISQEGDLRLSWGGRTDANGRFRAQVARDEGFTDLVVEQSTQDHVVTATIAPGRYHWRVREESDDAAGKWSPAATFRIRRPEPVR